MKNIETEKLQVKINMLKHILKLSLKNNEEDKAAEIEKQIQDIKEQMIKLCQE